MEGIKHSRQFAETESLMDNYFVCHIVPVMKQTQAYLNEKQGEEMKEYSTSIGGILSMMATAGQPLGDPYQTLKVTGEWNSKTTEDYIAMCREKIVSSDEMQHDLACIAGQWRHAVVQEIGRERYDELSKELGCDLAYAYVDYRVEQLMIDKLVKERMPKSSAEYIIRKAAESSLLGLPQVLGRSPLAEEIEARGEAAYRPGKVEKGAAWALGVSVDTLMLGGAGSWTTFAKFIGADAAVAAVAGHLDKDKPEGPTVETCISKGVFGIDGNVFTMFRKEAAAISPQENVTLAAANNVLRKKIPVCEFDFTKWMQVGNTQWWPDFGATEHDRKEKYKDVPLIVAPGQEEAYLRDLERQKAEVSAAIDSGRIDLKSLLPGMKSCTLTINENGKAVLHADNGNMQMSRELSSAELSRLSATLNNRSLSEETKRMRVSGLLNTVILSETASRNFEMGMEQLQGQTEGLKR